MQVPIFSWLAWQRFFWSYKSVQLLKSEHSKAQALYTSFLPQEGIIDAYESQLQTTELFGGNFALHWLMNDPRRSIFTCSFEASSATQKSNLQSAMKFRASINAVQGRSQCSLKRFSHSLWHGSALFGTWIVYFTQVNNAIFVLWKSKNYHFLPRLH